MYPYNVLKIKVLDVEVAYIDEGDPNATPLVFVHGLASYLMVWRKNVALLSWKYRCLALDLPGYGQSDKQRTNLGIDFYSDLVVEFAERLGLRNPILVGHSMGGQASIWAVLKRPQRFQRLVLVAPAGFERFNAFQRTWLRHTFSRDNLRHLTRQRVALNMGENFKQFPKDALFLVQDGIENTFSNDFERYCSLLSNNVLSMIERPVFDRLRFVELPVLVIFGTDDNLIPNKLFSTQNTAALAQEGTAQFPNGQLFLVSDCGHFVQYERPDVVNFAIDKFCGL